MPEDPEESLTPTSSTEIDDGKPEDTAKSTEISLALPDVQLHEIPPTPNYRATLEKAQSTSRIKSPLPSFFNPLFRSQGTVNSLIIDALGQVGGFVKTLAEEIQIRDRLLEKMVDHINRQGRGAGQRLNQVDQEVEEIQRAVSTLRDHTHDSEAKIKNLGDQAHVRIAGLVSALRANDSRLSQIEEETQETAPAVRNQLEALQTEMLELKAETTKAIAATREDAERQIAEREQRVIALTLDLQTRLNLLEDSRGESASKEAEISASLDEFKSRSANRSEALERRTNELQQELRALTTQLEDETRHRAALADEMERKDSTLHSRLGKLEGDLIALQTVFNQLESRLSQRLEEAAGARDLLGQRADVTGNEIKALATDLESLKEEHRQIAPLLAAVESSMRAGDSSTAEVAESVDQLKVEIGTISERMAEVSGLSQAQQASLDSLDEAMTSARREMALRRADEAEFLEEVKGILRKKIVPRADGGVAAERALQRLEAKKKRTLDAFYTAFEDRFRGSREEVKSKTRVYLKHVGQAMEDLGLKPSEFRLIDIGCGRGEWLELARENGIEVQGVDSNRVMVEFCKRLHLKATEDDGTAFLKRQSPRSFHGISAFHLMEHLPLEVLLDFFSLAQRALKPGGVLILETPNPENFRVGAYTFNFDATHLKPIPPELMRFYGEQCGLEPIETIRLNRYTDLPGTEESPNPFLARILDGALDYGTVFRKQS